jgi:predicted transcriptional regulator
MSDFSYNFNHEKFLFSCDEILNYIWLNENVTQTKIYKKFNITSSNTYKKLQYLKNKNLIIDKKVGREKFLIPLII